MISSPCSGLQQRARVTIKSSMPRTTIESSPKRIRRLTARTPLRSRDSFCLSSCSNCSWSEVLRDNVARHQLAVTDRRQQIVDAPVAIIAGDALHVLVGIAEHFLGDS